MTPRDPNDRTSWTYTALCWLRRPGRATEETSYPKPIKLGGMMASGCVRSRIRLADGVSCTDCHALASARRAAPDPAASAAPWRNLRRFITISPGKVALSQKRLGWLHWSAKRRACYFDRSTKEFAAFGYIEPVQILASESEVGNGSVFGESSGSSAMCRFPHSATRFCKF